MAKKEILLKYQESDIKLRRIMDEIGLSEDGKRMERAKSAFASAKQSVSEAETQAESINKFFEKAENFCNELMPQIESMASELATEIDPEKIEQIKEKLNLAKNKIIDIEKRVASTKAQGDKSVEGYTDAQNLGKKARTMHADAKQKMDLLKAERQAEITQLETVLKTLEVQIDKDVLARYLALASEHKFPPFVPLVGKSCGGCGMEMSISSQATIAKAEIGKCDNCQRMLYYNK